MREGRGLIEPPIDLAIGTHHQFPPFFFERHGRVGRNITLAGFIQLTENIDGGDGAVISAGGFEVEGCNQSRRENLRSVAYRSTANINGSSSAAASIMNGTSVLTGPRKPSAVASSPA